MDFRVMDFKQYKTTYFVNASFEVTEAPKFETSRQNDATSRIGWSICYGLVSVPTVIGNILVLLCLSKFRDARSSIHILVGNLAFADLMVGALLLPYCIIVDSVQLNSDKYVCLVKAALTVFTVGGACIGLFFVSIDRFTAVCFPLRHHVIMSSRRIVTMLVCGWSYISVLAFLPVSGWNFYDRTIPITCFYGDVVTPIYHRVVNANFVVLLAINFTLYIIVMRIALDKSRKIYPMNLDSETYCSTIRRGKKDLYKVKTMAMVQGLFALCWFPYICLAVILLIHNDHQLKVIQYWTLIPGILNSAFNWMIYGYRNRLLGNHMKSYLKCRSDET